MREKTGDYPGQLYAWIRRELAHLTPDERQQLYERRELHDPAAGGHATFSNEQLRQLYPVTAVCRDCPLPVPYERVGFIVFKDRTPPRTYYQYRHKPWKADGGECQKDIRQVSVPSSSG